MPVKKRTIGLLLLVSLLMGLSSFVPASSLDDKKKDKQTSGNEK